MLKYASSRVIWDNIPYFLQFGHHFVIYSTNVHNKNKQFLLDITSSVLLCIK